MGLLEQGAKWLREQRKACLAVTVKYCPQTGSPKNISATVGKTLFRAENQYGVTVRIESRDFIVSADDVDFIPERGDVIVYNGKCYEVLAPNGEPVWRWSGNGNWSRRIHTKEIGDE